MNKATLWLLRSDIEGAKHLIDLLGNEEFFNSITGLLEDALENVERLEREGNDNA